MPMKPPTFRPPGWKPAPNKRVEVQDPYYGTWAWKRLRSFVLKRDGYQCTEPKCPTPERGKGGRLIAGHIVERRKGGADHPSNVRTFCPTCDNRHHSDKGAMAHG